MHKLVRMTQQLQGARTPTWTLGDRLRKARELTGLGLRDFATEIGVGRNSVTAYESGKTPPKHVVMAWALRTGVSFEWLRDGTHPFGDGDSPQSGTNSHTPGTVIELHPFGQLKQTA